MKQKTKATLAGLLGYGIFGFSFLASKIALNAVPPFMLLSLRFMVAFTALNLMLLCGKIPFSLRGKPIALLMLLGIVQPVLYFIFETYGIAMTSSSFSGVMLGLSPVMGLLLGAVFLKERYSIFRAVCTVLSVVGVALTTTGGIGQISLVGFWMLMGAVLSASVFVILSQRLAAQFSPFERTYVMFGLGSAVFTVIAVLQNPGDPSAWLRPLSDLNVWWSVLYLAVVSSVCAFMLINYAVNHISAGHALIYSNFTTVISVIAGILIMGERFSAVQLTGVVVIVSSVFGVSLRSEAG